jgi:Ca2+/Na+ antiporter
VAVPADLGLADWGVFVGGAFLLVLHAWTGAKVSRWEGALMLCVFIGYVAYLVAGATGYI